MDGDIAGLLDEHPCRLIGDVKLGKDNPFVVVDVVETDAVPDHEIVH